MAALKKSSFYHTRKNICNTKKAAEILGVEISEVERMDQEKYWGNRLGRMVF